MTVQASPSSASPVNSEPTKAGPAAAAEERGVDVCRLGPFAPKTQSGAAAADAAVHSGVTACIAFNDLIAIGMLQRLRERGIRVPEDMSVVGCDDIFGADFCNPPLTTMASPIEQAGPKSCRLFHVCDPVR